MNKMIEQNKYLFEEYDDYNDCEQCGGASSTCYIISLSETRMNIYSQLALYTHHAMTMNVHHYHY